MRDVDGRGSDNKEAAEYLRLSTDTLKRLARNGSLFAAKAGRQWRWRKSDLDDFLARGGVREELDKEYVADIQRRLNEPTISHEELMRS